MNGRLWFVNRIRPPFGAPENDVNDNDAKFPPEFRLSKSNREKKD